MYWNRWTSSSPQCMEKLFFFFPVFWCAFFVSGPRHCSRLLREDDSVRSGPRRHALSADLRRGKAASLHRRDRRGMLDHPHGVQHLAVPPSQEKERSEHELRRHSQRYGSELDDDLFCTEFLFRATLPNMFRYTVLKGKKQVKEKVKY